MWRACPPTPGCSWARWTSRTWTISRASVPAISIDQKTTSKNPRSTVGTVTEIYDYLRLLWARAGTPHCPNCGKEIRQQTIDQIIDQVLALPEGTRIQVMAPVIRGKKGEHAKVFEDAKRSGYVRARVDGNLYELDEEIKLEKNKKHSIEIIVDRLIIRPDIRQRLTDSVETAAKLSGGLVIVNLLREEKDLSFSQNYACEDCGISMEELTPRMFSFNNPFGACPTCTGLGEPVEGRPGPHDPGWGQVHFRRGDSGQRLEQHPRGWYFPDVLRCFEQKVQVFPDGAVEQSQR